MNEGDTEKVSNSQLQEKREKEATVKRSQVHQGKIFTVFRDEIVYDNHLKKTFDLVIHPGAVAIIPINEKGELVLVKQWRRAAKQILIELPAGTLEKEEDPLFCANRELQEETGFRSEKITHLGGFYSAPGILSEYIHLYLAEKLVADPLMGEDTDEIDLITLSVEKAVQMISTGEIIDAKTITGVLWYKNIIAKTV
ncbi:MAG: NUDIX hydrolase [Chlamydiales bacterium]|nr:NUDIX hydrolase [Chlamydiia bacterium]MCP5504525.1 NUDIX hydrolase [Chlamydiales bacterium]